MLIVISVFFIQEKVIALRKYSWRYWGVKRWNCYWIVTWTHAGVLDWAETPCFCWGNSFSAYCDHFVTVIPVTKWMLRLKQCKLYSMAKEWRSRNLVHKSASRPNRVETSNVQDDWSNKGASWQEWEGYSRHIQEQRCGLGPDLMQSSFSSLLWALPVVRAVFMALVGVLFSMLKYYSEGIMRFNVYRKSNLPPSWAWLVLTTSCFPLCSFLLKLQ